MMMRFIAILALVAFALPILMKSSLPADHQSGMRMIWEHQHHLQDHHHGQDATSVAIDDNRIPFGLMTVLADLLHLDSMPGKLKTGDAPAEPVMVLSGILLAILTLLLVPPVNTASSFRPPDRLARQAAQTWLHTARIRQ